MPTANMTVSLDPSVIALAKNQAAQHGMAASAWVAKLIRDATVAESARRHAEFERTAPDADAIAVLDQAHDADQVRRLAGSEW
jgi:hypothetical protein